MDVERPGRVRGFSLAELLLTLALLLAVVLGVLYVVDRRTRLLPEPARASDLESRLAAALKQVARDAEAAVATGGHDALRPVADNTAPGAFYRDASGRAVPVRAGTDQFGIRDRVWFVARGVEGGEESDRLLASLAFPHPYLAVARALEADRWEITAVCEEVEDFQVAWGLREAGGGLAWRGGERGSSAPAAADLVDGSGASRLAALKLAATIKSGKRLTRADGPPPPDPEILLNAPAPGQMPGAAPVGWVEDPRQRVWFARASRTEIVQLFPVPTPPAPTRAPGWRADIRG
jgi:hypothetical protein